MSNLWFVVPVAADAAASFKRQFQIPHQLICDPFRDLYRDFGLKTGGLTSTIGPKVWGPGLRTLSKGNAPGLFKGNMFQLGGVAVLTVEGEIVYRRTFSSSSEEATPEELSSWLA